MMGPGGAVARPRGGGAPSRDALNRAWDLSARLCGDAVPPRVRAVTEGEAKMFGIPDGGLAAYHPGLATIYLTGRHPWDTDPDMLHRVIAHEVGHHLTQAIGAPHWEAVREGYSRSPDHPDSREGVREGAADQFVVHHGLEPNEMYTGRVGEFAAGYAAGRAHMAARLSGTP